MAETEKLTTKQIAEAVVAEAGVDPQDIPHVTRFVDPRNADWQMGGSVPNSKNWIIIAMFMLDNDVRVYGAPLREKDDSGAPVPFTRFTLSRTAASLVCESFPKLDTFKSEIAAELVRVAEEAGLTEEETEPEIAQQANGAVGQPTS